MYKRQAGLYALENHVERLAEDHRRAQTLAGLLSSRPEISGCMPVETNIVIVTLAEGLQAVDYVAQLREKGILAAAFGKDKVRFVTHLDITDEHVQAFEERLKAMIVGFS